MAKICGKCGDSFLTRVKIDGKSCVLGNRRFCLNCSPYGQHNTKALDEVEDIPEGKKRCRRCRDVLPLERFSPRGKRPGYYPYCRQCEIKRIMLHMDRLKEQAVEYKGGNCLICGYDRCVKALHFHHRDPDLKEIAISKFKGSFEKLKIELDKCDLLCANCHAEKHDMIEKHEDVDVATVASQ